MGNQLVLVRHGQSEWNKLNLFTGWHDVALTNEGIKEAKAGGRALEGDGIKFDAAYTSALKRAQDTLTIILKELGQVELPFTKDPALNERDYGELTGLNKDDARIRWGNEQVHIWRRSFDVSPPGGESLKDTTARTLPYYRTQILPDVLEGKVTIIVAHGNSLRSIVMEIEQLSGDEIVQRELVTGVPIIYEIDAMGRPLSKRDLTT